MKAVIHRSTAGVLSRERRRNRQRVSGFFEGDGGRFARFESSKKGASRRVVRFTVRRDPAS